MIQTSIYLFGIRLFGICLFGIRYLVFAFAGIRSIWYLSFFTIRRPLNLTQCDDNQNVLFFFLESVSIGCMIYETQSGMDRVSMVTITQITLKDYFFNASLYV